MLSAGQVYLRPAEREDIPLFVRWLSDARTNRHLLLRSPISLAMEERWFDEMLEHHGRDRWFYVICRHADDRPVGSLDLHEIDGINGGAGLGIVIGDPGDTSHGYGSDAMTALITSDSISFACGGSGSTSTTTTLAREPCTSDSGSSSRPRSGTVCSGAAASSTSTGWPSCATSGPRGRAASALRAKFAPIEGLEQAVDRLEERLGHGFRQDVADRILRPECRPRPHGREADIAEIAIAKPVRQRPQVDLPPLGGDFGGGQRAVGVTRGDQGGLVDDGHLVAGRPDRAGRTAAPPGVRHPAQ